MPKFTRADPKVVGKPDARGKVQVKVTLINPDPRLQQVMPINGNRKEEFFVQDATVGEVYDAVQAALFEIRENG